MKWLFVAVGALASSCLNSGKMGTEVEEDPNAKGQCPCENALMQSARTPAPTDGGVSLCPKTDATNRCLSLEVTFDMNTRRNVKGDFRGPLRWALYRGGDVGIPEGPKAPSIKGGDIDDADFSLQNGVDPTYRISVGDVPSAWYQVLVYLDDDENQESNGGDTVMWPEGSFAVPKGKDLIKPVSRNYVR